MEFEFDKEIDVLLRKSRVRETASADDPKSEIQNSKFAHLDADDISAFAENALPEKTKLLYMSHLADCPRCRQILSNVISLNSEADIETASSTVSANEKTVAASVPWYRKLLVFPQIAYTMSGLVLIFSGLMVYLLLQNAAQSSDSMISKVTDSPQNMRQSNSSAAQTSGETAYSNANLAMPSGKAAANTSLSNASANAAATPSATTTANSPNAARREPAERDKEVTAAPAPPPPPIALSEQPLAGSAAPSSVASQNKPSATPADDKKKEAEKSAEDARAADQSSKNDDAVESQMTRSAPAPKPAVRKAVQSETKSVGGRNFTRKDGVWYDANYQGQATANISRGSDDYKKLDAGLRSIAGSFSGTVVIVYQSKAYRIQ